MVFHGIIIVSVRSSLNNQNKKKNRDIQTFDFCYGSFIHYTRVGHEPWRLIIRSSHTRTPAAPKPERKEENPNFRFTDGPRIPRNAEERKTLRRHSDKLSPMLIHCRWLENNKEEISAIYGFKMENADVIGQR